MTRFTGRAKEKVTILSKPIPTGIKGWALAEKGYFLHWLWHAKRKGPQGFPKKPKELNATVAVVPALLSTLLQKGPGSYGVTLDNLFTSTNLLVYLSAIGYGAQGTTRANSGIHVDLVQRKKLDNKNDSIPWGTKDIRYVADGKVSQLGWKDNVYSLFLSTMEDGTEDIETNCRRPNTSMKHAKLARKAFSDDAVKMLPRPKLTYAYNILMNQVDRGDQRRAAYPIHQRQMKTWKAMFYELVNIAVVNSYLLSYHSDVPKKERFTNQLAFRIALYEALFKHSKPSNSIYSLACHKSEDRVQIKYSIYLVCKGESAMKS